MSGSPPPIPLLPPFALGRRPNVTDVYANQLRMGVTLSDFTLIFSVTEDYGQGVAEVVDKAAVRLAPMTFKALLLNMKGALDAYEKSVGNIIISPVAVTEATKNGAMLTEALRTLMTPQEPSNPAT